MKILLFLFATGCQLLAFSFPLKAQYTNLLNFNDFNGIYPVGDLTLSGGLLYGMTPYGGAYDEGCIFSMDTNGGLYMDLHDFNDTNGAIPYGSLIHSGSRLYGMTSTGGTYDSGCVFSINTSGGGYTILHYFTDTNGAFPHGDLILSGRTLFGMTSAGGRHDSGCIFSIDTDGSSYRDLHDFRDTNGHPYGSLTWVNGKLFGMASYGEYKVPVHIGDSTIYDSGCIFSIDTNGSNYKVLYNFTGPYGAYPWGSLMLLKDRLYGMTSAGGGYHKGCAFSIDTNGGGYSYLYSFQGIANGANPHGSFIYASTNLLYGMTSRGGVNDSGCIFTLDTNGGRFKDLFNFKDTSGIYPHGSLALSGSSLYGMAEYGGRYNIGVVFKVDTNNYRYTAINEVRTSSGTISVYPNPNNGIFTIQSSIVSGRSVVEIYNMLGEKVYTEAQSQGYKNTTINLTGQPNGVYLYRVVSDNGGVVGEGKMVIR